MVPLLPLVLFSGFDIDISVYNGDTFLVLEDGWIMFRVDEHKVNCQKEGIFFCYMLIQIAEMVKMMRVELVGLLEEKIADPLLNLMHHDKGEKIITTILNLITNEQIVNAICTL